MHWLQESLRGSSDNYKLEHKVHEIALRKDDPAPTYKNTSAKDLIFSGEIIVEVEEYWSIPEIVGTRFENEIVNRLALYKKDLGAYIAEQLRYNHRALFGPLPDDNLPEIPYMSKVEEFSSQQDATKWLRHTDMYKEGNIASKFEESLSMEIDYSDPEEDPRIT